MNILSKTKNRSVLNDLVKNDPGALSFLKAGDMVEGLILEKGSRIILVDLGQHGTGAVYRKEFLNAKEVIRNTVKGSKILGKVVEVDNENGYIELSVSEAGLEKAWDAIAELQEKEEVFKVKPLGFNKGGLIIDIKGVKAFLPLSQLSSQHYPKVPDGDKLKITQELQKLVNQEFSVKIIDANSKNGKLIVSEKEACGESMKELASKYAVGQVVEGVISGAANFGAFMRFADNPAIEGLIHISELDHRLIENPKEAVNIDDLVKAKIIEIKDGRIYLSLKALKPDPWLNIKDKYQENQEVRGRVYGFNPFGATINFGDVQGQIHITEFGGVSEMKTALEQGKDYSFVITGIKPEEKRISLKLKKD